MGDSEKWPQMICQKMAISSSRQARKSIIADNYFKVFFSFYYKSVGYYQTLILDFLKYKVYKNVLEGKD